MPTLISIPVTPPPALIGPPAPSLDHAPPVILFGRDERHRPHRANADAAHARAIELQSQAEATNARVATRAEEARQRQAELQAREQEEQARELARQQRARDDEDRARQTGRAAARERADVLSAEQARRREAAEREAVIERTRLDEQIRQQQAALAQAQADARARGIAEKQLRTLARETERLDAERIEAERAAARLRRPECREADRVVREERASLERSGITSVHDIVLKMQAGMRTEMCSAARKTFTSTERMRSAAARCDLAEAIPFNEFASGMRDLILEHGC